MTIRWILEGVCVKKPRNNIICRLLQGLWHHTQREDWANTTHLRPYPKKPSQPLCYIKTKVKVCFPDGDTDYFDIVAGVLQGDTLALHLFIICLDHLFRTSIDKMKDNSFKLTKERSRRYPTQTITDADYTDDIALLANIPPQTETLLHNLERAAAGIGLHVNTNKTEYMSFNQRGDIFTLNSSSLKLVDKFTYQGSSVSSTKTDINTRLAKAWTAIDRLSVIWKSDLTNKIKVFSKQRSYWYYYMDANICRKSLTAIT